MAVYNALLYRSHELLVHVIQQEESLVPKDAQLEYFACNPHYVSYRLKFSYLNHNRKIYIPAEQIREHIPWPLLGDEDILAATYPETNFWVYQALADLVGQHFRGRNWITESGAGESSNTLLNYTSLVAQQTTSDNPNETVFGSVFWPRYNLRNIWWSL